MYPSDIICGIDPGASGGIALVSKSDPTFCQAFPMPETEDDLADALREFPIMCAYLEIIQFGGNPADGKTSKTAMVKFGIGYGKLLGALAALKIRREHVSPQKWQAALGIPKREGKSKNEHKNVIKQRAQGLFPALKITLKTSDALCIAEYGRRQP